MKTNLHTSKIGLTPIFVAISAAFLAVNANATPPSSVGAEFDQAANANNTPAQSQPLTHILDDASPLILLSSKMGAVASEAVSSGVPVITNAALAKERPDGLLYIDVDTLSPTDYRSAFDTLRQGVARGALAVIETSEFNFEKLRAIVKVEFPSIDPQTIQDVAALVHITNGEVKATRIDPSELAMVLGVPEAMTVSGRIKSMAAENVKKNSKAYTEPPSEQRYALYFSQKAYDTSPTDANYKLILDNTFVDVWQKKTNGAICYVAWRGSLNLSDFYADLRAQIAATNERITTDNSNVRAYGARGFVNRLHAYDNAVNDALDIKNCTNIFITGHSLGGALAQLHGLQLAYSDNLDGFTQGMVAWNPPNVVNPATYNAYFLTVATGYEIWETNCRNHDFLVNRVPTGLVKLGPSGAAIPGCTYIAPGTPTANIRLNHGIDLWWGNY